MIENDLLLSRERGGPVPNRLFSFYMAKQRHVRWPYRSPPKQQRWWGGRERRKRRFLGMGIWVFVTLSPKIPMFPPPATLMKFQHNLYKPADEGEFEF